MKKSTQILFIFLAALFVFKGIAILVISAKAGVYYTLDVSESESEEKDEKEDTKEKETFEEGNLNASRIVLLNYLSPITYWDYPQKNHYTPHFEVCSPPPEVI